MKDLYKGRYLIAVYDETDTCVGVFGSIKEIMKIRKLNNPYSMFYRILNGKYQFSSNTYHLIDCLEEHEDIFVEEDALFLKECNNNLNSLIENDVYEEKDL